MKQEINFQALLWVPVMAALIMTQSCKKSSSTNNNTTPPTTTHGKGWSATDNPKTVPQGVSLASLTGSSNLPSKVDLTPFCPPIGDQGQTETCVAWSSAYYGKTISEAIAFNYNQSQLTNPAYQLSPKDMFMEIPDPTKGVNCQAGTQITYALSAMIDTGVATEATVPWDPNISNCSQNQLQASWLKEAANHTISYYRTISATVDGIKQILAQNIPVLMGIDVSNEFEAYKSGVITSATGSLGGHAQCIVGYDDSQGAGGAFHVANSWGTSWGENGYYWIDYNTLVNNYIENGNVYYMVSSTTNTVDTIPTVTTTTTGADIAAWVFTDYSTYSTTSDPTSRTMWLNLYNIGSGTASASSTWDVYYVYVNAFNANDYGVIFHDQFNNTIGANTYNCATNDACTFNYNIPGGSNFAQVAFGDPEIYRNYNVPNISGYYYLALIADPNNKLGETNMQNNIFYTTGQLPASFLNGYTNSYDPNARAIRDSSKNELEANPQNLRKSRFNSAVSRYNKNGYTSQEILGFIKAKYGTGELQQKANALKLNHKKLLSQVHDN